MFDICQRKGHWTIKKWILEKVYDMYIEIDAILIVKKHNIRNKITLPNKSIVYLIWIHIVLCVWKCLKILNWINLNWKGFVSLSYVYGKERLHGFPFLMVNFYADKYRSGVQTELSLDPCKEIPTYKAKNHTA